jgi:hypothetical protein
MAILWCKDSCKRVGNIMFKLKRIDIKFMFFFLFFLHFNWLEESTTLNYSL